jgi:hypothetical protein
MCFTIQSSLRDLHTILELIPGTQVPGYWQSSLSGLLKHLRSAARSGRRIYIGSSSMARFFGGGAVAVASSFP